MAQRSTMALAGLGFVSNFLLAARFAAANGVCQQGSIVENLKGGALEIAAIRAWVRFLFYCGALGRGWLVRAFKNGIGGDLGLFLMSAKFCLWQCLASLLTL